MWSAKKRKTQQVYGDSNVFVKRRERATVEKVVSVQNRIPLSAPWVCSECDLVFEHAHGQLHCACANQAQRQAAGRRSSAQRQEGDDKG